jgi:hypothetical protein
MYSSPVKNMRVAEAAAAELGNLEGEELRWQQQRLQELLANVNRQQKDRQREEAGRPAPSTSWPPCSRWSQAGAAGVFLTRQPAAGRIPWSKH